MATTRAEVIRRAVYLTRRGLSTIDGVNALVASSGAVGSITDTDALPSTGASTDLFAEQWLNRPNADNSEDRKRLIGDGDYTASTRVLLHDGPDYTEAPLAGAPADDGVYLITVDDIDDWNIAFNEALLTELFRLHYLEFDPTDGDRRQYDPTATPISAAWLTDRSMIRAIETRDDGQAANERQWVEYSIGFRAWDAYEDQGSLSLDFKYGTPPQTDETIRIIATRPYKTVTSDSTSIAVEEEWAVLATISKMAEMLGDFTDLENDWSQIMRQRRIAQRLGMKRLKHLGKYAGTAATRGNIRKAGTVAPVRTAR